MRSRLRGYPSCWLPHLRTGGHAACRTAGCGAAPPAPASHGRRRLLPPRARLCPRGPVCPPPAEVIRSADLLSYTAEEGVRFFGEVPCACVGACWVKWGMMQRLARWCRPNQGGGWCSALPAEHPACDGGGGGAVRGVPHSAPARAAPPGAGRARGAPSPSAPTSAPLSPVPCVCVQGKLLTSDSFPGQDRTKLCLASKVGCRRGRGAGRSLGCRPGRRGLAPGGPSGAGSGRLTATPLLCPNTQVPLGVVLAIPPFNYPVNLAVRWVWAEGVAVRVVACDGVVPSRPQAPPHPAPHPTLPRPPCSKIGPALIAGNSVVLKPPTQGSVAGLLMMACFVAAGMPPGLVNCVTGGRRRGRCGFWPGLWACAPAPAACMGRRAFLIALLPCPPPPHSRTTPHQ